ncbi:MAG TPA: TlpA disulfide reductase family protein [Bacteroidales bacterium]|nr:TlpA disulfide reductase family protein [Bacteroidales bacterium]
MKYGILQVSLFLLGIAFCISAQNISGQNVSIKGSAKGAEGKTILLKYYSDCFTLNEEFLSTSTVDSSGYFEIECQVPSTVLAVIHIEYYAGEIYLEQNKSYQVEIKNLVFNEKLDKVNYYLNPFNCYIKVLSEDKKELNQLTQKLNIMYNSFVKENLYILKTKSIYSRVDTFMMAVNDTFSNTKNVFFDNYLNYRLGSLKLMTGYSDSYKLMIDYLYQKPILYDNIEYMTFLAGYFENYFQNLNSPVLLKDLYIPVNTNKSYAEFMDVLGKDTLFINEKLRELIALNTLNVMYASSNFKKKNIIDILKFIASASKFETHRQIAGSMVSYFSRYERGTPAKEFSLKSSENSPVNLSDFRGKYVYLNFYTSWCQSCKEEMEVMKNLRQNFNDDVVFISISADREFMNMYYFKRDYKYNWLFLHFGNNYDLLESYGIFAYPGFVLIDKSGNLIQCPALKPSENIELYLTNLINNDKAKP